MEKKQKRYSRKWRLAQKLEIKWWKNYLQKQEIEPYLKAKKVYWNKVLQQLKLAIPTHAKILDAGCGPAGIFTVFPQQFVLAIDPLLEQYEQELTHFQKDWYPNVHFLEQRLEEYSSEEQFDIIFCLNAINHVDDIKLSLQKLMANLDRNGTIIISTDVHKSSWLMRLFQWIPGDVLHPHQYDLSGYLNLFETAGIDIKQSLRLKKGQVFEYWIFVGRKGQ